MSRATWYRRHRKVITVEMLFRYQKKRAQRTAGKSRRTP